MSKQQSSEEQSSRVLFEVAEGESEKIGFGMDLSDSTGQEHDQASQDGTSLNERPSRQQEKQDLKSILAAVNTSGDQQRADHSGSKMMEADALEDPKTEENKGTEQ